MDQSRKQNSYKAKNADKLDIKDKSVFVIERQSYTSAFTKRQNKSPLAT